MNYRKVMKGSRLLTIGLMSLTGAVMLLPAGFAASLQSNRSSGPFLDQIHLAWGWGRRVGRRMGPRGDAYCLVAPLFDQQNGQTTKVWSSQPTLVWQGTLEWIKFYPAGNSSLAQEVALPEQTGGSLHSVQLTQVLQPGQTYTFVFKEAKLKASPGFSLQVMTEAEQEQVGADLQTIAAQGGSAEDIAVRQADYFVDRGLWSDFWQTVLAVESPSQQFKSELQDTVDSVCPPAASPQPFPSSQS